MPKKSEISIDAFSRVTSLLPDVVAKTVLDNMLGNNRELPTEQREYFLNHVTQRTLHLYNTNKRWQQTLRSSSGRDFLYNFVEHWCGAFLKNTVEFIEMHPLGVEVV